MAERVAIGIVLLALLLGLFNDFTIRGRVADSFSARSGLPVDHCTRFTSLELQAKNHFSCTVDRPGRAAVVYGSRFLGRHRVFLFSHYLGNRLLTLLTNVLYNTMLTDMETCFKAMRVEVLRSMTLRSNRFGIEPELTAKIFKRGYRVYEIPITYDGRGYEDGKKITWRDGLVAIWTLIKYRFTE